MNWQTPKTNWTARDFFDLDPDLVRMGQNLALLQKEAARTAGLKAAGDLPLPGLGEALSAALLNRIEQAADELAALCQIGFVRHAEFLPGDAFWSWRDLNRLETALQEIRAALLSRQAAQPVLSFTLGGDFFGA
ncbi:hypothetical protein EVA_07459 [gut metagenome]|uniref:Uncharacterized protein n=1 Tax=gut metagenome TaxID=749906 RepID=J9CW23_9ZZZZ